MAVLSVDLPFDYPTPATNDGSKCSRHHWNLPPYLDEADRRGAVCTNCKALRDEVRSRRGRRANTRGRRIQHELNARVGLTNIVGNAQNHDGGRYDEMFASEAKSGAAFPERLWRWLKGVPTTGSQTAILLVADAPGPGHKRRAVVVLDIEDWIALHGPTR